MHWAWKTGVGGDCNLELAMFIRVSLEGTLTLRMKRERDCPLATRSKQLHHWENEKYLVFQESSSFANNGNSNRSVALQCRDLSREFCTME